MKAEIIEKKGIFLIILFSFVMHSAYTLTGLPFLKLICPTSENIWEHSKMMYFAGLIFYSYEYFFIENRNNFFIIKFISLLILFFGVPMLFYTYSNIIGQSVILVDISISVVLAIISQTVGVHMHKYLKRERKILDFISLGLIVIFSIILIYFSFFPLNTPIFW